MAGKNVFRWDKARTNELKREIKNYNARLKRAEKRYGIDLSKLSVSYKGLKGVIDSKREYNRTIKLLQSATYKTLTPKGRSEKTDFERKIERNRVRRVERRNKLTTIDLDKRRAELLSTADFSRRLGRLYDGRDFVIMEINRSLGNSDIERVENWLNNNRSRSENWRQNYLKSLVKSAQYAALQGDTARVDQLRDVYTFVESLDLIDFLIAQIVDGYILSIDMQYRDMTMMLGSEDNKLLDTWKKYGKG